MNPNVRERIEHYLQLLISPIDSKATVEFIQEGTQWRINIDCSIDPDLFIGEKSETLVAIQHVLRTLVHKNLPDDRTHFILDVRLYRKKREENITNKLPILIEKFAINQGKSLVLTGLSSYERLLIHHYLAEAKGVQTLSVGMSTSRKMLIMPSGESGSTGGLDNAIVVDIEKLMEDSKEI